MQAEFNVSVHLSAEKKETVRVSGKGSILEVKEAISQKTGQDPHLFSVIFSGKILDEKSELKDLQLGAHSVLHVINRKQKESVARGALESTNTGTCVSRYQFYVYCKICQSLEPGKLRVRCMKCLEGGVVLEREPSGWDDVLSPRRLICQCTTCDSEQFAQFYFKCASHDGEDVAAPLRYIRPNSRSVDCITCTSESSPVLVYPCKDKHVICVECFKMYVQVCLDNRTFVQQGEIGYTLPCPAGCHNSFIRDTHHFQLLGKSQYERYKDFGAEEWLIEAGGVVCPQPQCGEGMVVDETARTVQCQTCQYEFCRQCRQEVHSGECLQTDISGALNGYSNIDPEQALRARWNLQSLDTIQKITKPCPKCSTRTERNGGCMHIRCTRCKEDWCWLCEKSWSRSCQGDHWFG